MTEQSLDQRRAKHALDRINKIKEHKKQSDYLSYVKALPASIVQNGFGQAVATLLAAAKSKKDDPHCLLYQDLAHWLCRDDEDAPYRGARNLLEAITTNDQQHYLHAQAEAQRYLSWLKKIAAAYLKAESQNTASGGDGNG